MEQFVQAELPIFRKNLLVTIESLFDPFSS